jgi:flagellar biosynthesis/type III secretory pathway M-ring protein FliF/YscJ
VWIGAGVLGAALILAAWFLLRRRARHRALADVARSLQMQEARASAPSADLATTAGLEAESEAVMPGVPEEFVRVSKEREGLRQKALGLASSEPEVAAQLIRAWMVKKKALQPVGAGHDAS